MLNLNSVMIGTKQPAALAAFYEKVLGKPADMVDRDNGFWGWQVGSAYISVLDHSEMGGAVKDPGRVMFNFETPQVKEEFERVGLQFDAGDQYLGSAEVDRRLDSHGCDIARPRFLVQFMAHRLFRSSLLKGFDTVWRVVRRKGYREGGPGPRSD